MTSAPEPRPPEPPSDPWARPTTSLPAPLPVAPYLSSPEPYLSSPEPYLSPAPAQASAPHSGPPAPHPGSPYPGAQLASPSDAAFAAPSGPVILQVGEIAVTSTMVCTPAGDIPLAGSTWHVTDYWHNEQRIPTWAIVMSVVAFCFIAVFSLLFLLAKETVYRGTVQITVTNGSRQYVARIPVTDQAQVAHLHQQVNYVRSLAAL